MDMDIDTNTYKLDTQYDCLMLNNVFFFFVLFTHNPTTFFPSIFFLFSFVLKQNQLLYLVIY